MTGPSEPMPNLIKPYRSKRIFDLAVLLVVAVPALMLGLGCALAVRLTSRGPVLFRQERVGKDGRLFVVLKFRTMLDGDNPVIPDASCITRAGLLLRRLSLDELPQLVNVARGEMSIVGPRPTLQYQVERWTPRQHERLAVRPGLTGWAQVNGRNDLSWPDRIDLDLEYVERQSVSFDVRVLSRTARTMLAGEGSGATAADDPIAQLDDGGVLSHDRQPAAS